MKAKSSLVTVELVLDYIIQGRKIAKKRGLDPYSSHGLGAVHTDAMMYSDAVKIHSWFQGLSSDEQAARLTDIENIKNGPKLSVEGPFSLVFVNDIFGVLQDNHAEIKNKNSHIRPFEKRECKKFLNGTLTDEKRASEFRTALSVLSNKDNVLVQSLHGRVLKLKAIRNCQHCGKEYKVSLMQRDSKVCQAPRCQMNMLRSSI